MAVRKRNIQIKFYVTEEEKQLIDGKLSQLPAKRNGKSEPEHPDEVLGNGGGKTAHRREDEPAPHKAIWGILAEDGD